MNASMNSPASNNSVVGSPLDLEIPEWKRILIMKKRATMNNSDSSTVHVNNGGFDMSDKFKKGTDYDFREITSLKKVTIGNINVELRSVNVFSSDSQQQRPLSDVSKMDSISQEFDSNNTGAPDDLQYGPGIVDRLRAKFLNMGVKQQCKPVVRRFSSLENLPGSNTGPYRINARGYYRQKSVPGLMNGGHGNVKKAQSMETLLGSTPPEFTTPSRRSSPRIFCGVKAKIFSKNSVLSSDENDEPTSKLFTKNYQRSVSASNINANELPKPDTVKHVKRIFESPPLNDGSEKTNHHQRFRKVPNSIPIPTSPCGLPNGNIRSPFQNKPFFEEEDELVDISPDAKLPSAKEEEFQNRDDECPLSKEDFPIISVEIIKTGDNLSLSEGVSDSEDIDVPSLLQDGVRSQTPNESIYTPDSSQNILLQDIILLSPEVDHKQPSISGPLSCAVSQPEPPSFLSPEEEIDIPPLPPARNSSNNSGEVMVVEGPKGGPSSWKRGPQPQSVVFDFRGKDVKPNISLNPTPFGCRPARRPSSPPRDSVGAVNGVAGVVSDEEDWDETDVGADLPAFSGIVFFGENVKIGRGALLEKRNKKLSIQFDDQATSTFEYPSETTSPSPNEENAPFNPDTAINSAANSRLSNYTPLVLNTSDNAFQLGVSSHRASFPLSPPCGMSEEDSPDSDVILPASPEDSAGWSSTETVDILF